MIKSMTGGDVVITYSRHLRPAPGGLHFYEIEANVVFKGEMYMARVIASPREIEDIDKHDDVQAAYDILIFDEISEKVESFVDHVNYCFG